MLVVCLRLCATDKSSVRRVRVELIVESEGRADEGLNEVISNQNPRGGLQYDDCS
jgi:hypothetical protein